LGLIEGITNAIPELIEMLPTIITQTVMVLTENFPLILNAGIALLQALCDGILAALPDLIAQMPLIIDSVINTLLSALPLIIDCGVQLLTALVDNLDVIIDQICAVMPDIINSVIKALLDHLPEIIEAGVTLFVALVENTPYIIEQLLRAVGEMLASVVGGILAYKDEIFDCGRQIVEGLWEGIKSMSDWLSDCIDDFCDSIKDAVEDAFDINSPSRVFRDEIGKNLARGIGVGFEEEIGEVSKQMTDASESLLDTMESGLLAQKNTIIGSLGDIFTIPKMDLTDINITHTLDAKELTPESGFDAMVSAFKEALSEVKIEMDDEEMGHFVDATVTRLVYS
jgi:phage-related protein